MPDFILHHTSHRAGKTIVAFATLRQSKHHANIAQIISDQNYFHLPVNQFHLIYINNTRIRNTDIHFIKD